MATKIKLKRMLSLVAKNRLKKSADVSTTFEKLPYL
jgi:hypothetical protein